MNSYQILYKNSVVLAVDLGSSNASEEIQSYSQQGFKIFSRIIQAASEEKAISIFKAENLSSNSNESVSVKSIFLFRTNKLQRLAYLGYSAASIATVIVLMMLVTSMGDSALVVMIPLFFGFIWFGLGLSVARWKNCGHNGWLYLLALVVTMLLDTFMMGIAGIILWLYLIFAPQAKSVNYS
ncbi:hypothetical protein [Vibrio ishigakensis]|uniref:hypothetical protein n=1 Tax=Vibrio ishigakensis TaxID=1481914 RepID=UPI0021C25D01|nr:hypothetical protein [Vibrio ishigakensis]